MKHALKDLINKSGYSIKKTSKGSNSYSVQRQIIANSNPTIFDVGAYDGQVSIEYNNIFPNSKIYAFEPFPESFSLLKKAVAPHYNISINNVALSSSTGKQTFFINGSHATNSLFATDKESKNFWKKELLETTKEIQVNTITLDQFCEENNISHIDILKLDVQGGEYNVLVGATNLLKKKNIKLVFMEIIIVPTYKGQKGLHDYLNFFTKFGYELTNIHDLVRNDTNLLQLDALFVANS